MERGLRLALAQKDKQPARRRVKLPISRLGGGVQPGINLNSNAALLEAMEENGRVR
jgi:hypothetical protein